MPYRRDLARLLALTGTERRRLIAYACLIPVLTAALRTLGLSRTRSWLQRLVPAAPALRDARSDRLRDRVEQTAQLVGIAARRGPLRGNCLASSLLLHAVLRRHGIASELRVGVRNDSVGFSAHAWVEIDGRPVNDTGDVGLRYAAFRADFAQLERPGA